MWKKNRNFAGGFSEMTKCGEFYKFTVMLNE